MKYRRLMICFVATICCFSIQAQFIPCEIINLKNGNFEEIGDCELESLGNGDVYFYAFNEGCVSPWGAAQGSPDVYKYFIGNNGVINPYEGDHFAALGVKSPCKHETIFRNVKLELDKDYYLSFRHQIGQFAETSTNFDLEIYLTTGLTNQFSSSLSNCVDPPPGSKLIYSQANFNASNWEYESFKFTPEEGLNQLYFVPRSNDETSAAASYWLLDDIVLEECDPCQRDLSAQFDLLIPSSNGSNYTLEADNFGLYDYLDGEHFWYVLTSSDPNGPYTPDGVVTGDTFSYPAEDGIWYTVIHKVITRCGEVCFGANNCRNCKGSRVNCDLCGPIDCDILDEWWPECNVGTPTGMSCYYNSATLETSLVWNSVPGATSYVINIIENSTFSDCCPSSELSESYEITVPVTDNKPWFTIDPSLESSCYVWAVKACCLDGCSDYSSYICMNSDTECKIVSPHIQTPKPEVSGNRSLLNIYPNPSTGFVQIEGGDDYEIKEVVLYNIYGQVVDQNFSVKNNKVALNLQTGTYVAKIKSTKGVVISKKLLITE